MQPPKVPSNEKQRIAALIESNLLDTPNEERFDRLTLLTRQIFKTSIVLISLVDTNRQWFKSKQGLDAEETKRNISFCGHAILNDEIFQIPDASQDPRFADNPLVVGSPEIRFYAGAPLRLGKDMRIGTLCIIDQKPRNLTDDELIILRSLANTVEREISQIELKQNQKALKQSESLGKAIAHAQSEFIVKESRQSAFDILLKDILNLTRSEYGFIGEVLYNEAQEPYLKTYAITNVAWNKETRDFYDKNAPQGMEFTNLKSLFGHVLSSSKPVIANDPANDPRSSGLPKGHPPLNAFLGIPVFHQGKMVAIAGMSNRGGGYNQQIIEFLHPLLASIGQLVVATRIQKEKEENESRLRAIIESTDIGTWEWNISTGQTVFNERSATIAGYSSTELKLTNIESWNQLINPENLHNKNQAVLKHFSGELNYYDIEYQVRHKKGHWIWIHDRGRIYSWDENSQPLLIYGTLTDITTRKQEEQERNHVSNFLSNVLYAASESIIVGTNQEGIITTFNRGAERLLGYTAEEVVNKLTPRIFHLPEEIESRQKELSQELGYDINGFQVLVEKAKQKGAETREWTFVRKNGEQFPVLLVITLMKDNNDEIVGYLGMATDITQQKLTNQMLKDQTQHTLAILDNMLDSIITIDQYGIIDSINPVTEKLFGYSKDEMLGQNIKMLTPSPHRENHDQYLRNYQQGGKPKVLGYNREVEGQRKDGSLFPMELSVSEVSRLDKIMYVGLIRDISERKRIERLKNEFVSTVSHELRTPLTSISGSLGLITGGALGTVPKQIEQMLIIAQKNSLRLTSLINDLLDMEKLEAGKMHFELKPHSLPLLLNNAIETNRAYGSDRNVTIKLKNKMPCIEVRVDEHRMMQILSNLLSNAIKFSSTQGEVIVQTEQKKSKVKVSIIDQGTGIPVAFKENIFQKFAQADSSDTRKKGGTGLGLSITKELVERMGGTIGYHSIEGEGSCFFFEFPICISQNINKTKQLME